RIDKLVRSFVDQVMSEGFELFLSPETEALRDLLQINDNVVFFQAKNGQLFKLRDDYTTTIVEFFNKNASDSLRVWYSGFVYRYDQTGQIQNTFQLGLEIVPYNSPQDSFVVLRVMLESILHSLTDELLVEIGDSRVIEKCVQHVPKKFRKKLFELIDRKDVSELEFFASLNDLDLSDVLKLVEASFTKRSVNQLKEFELDPSIEREIVELVDFLSGFSGVTVEIDFSLARTVEEYDGPTFIFFDLKDPSLIAAGGRYRVNERTLGVGGTIFLEERAWSR
ncbi:MAG: ATP phosphoribosyltransferase regulatory subunit, partial [Pseudothermotoga sp.]|uniref:ATP phosphoribosyltransferase regulatory subunit n=1 Tax=Pseudothermotoga sp. TaxID=2033661 RepID=UPI00258C8C4C